MRSFESAIERELIGHGAPERLGEIQAFGVGGHWTVAGVIRAGDEYVEGLGI